MDGQSALAGTIRPGGEGDALNAVAGETVSLIALLAVLAWAVTRPRGWPEAVAAVPASPGQTRTVALRLDGMADTSVLIRVPVPKEAQGRPAPSLMTKSGKTVVACEPVVSVLTEVAKQLQPGRCVT